MTLKTLRISGKIYPFKIKESETSRYLKLLQKYADKELQFETLSQEEYAFIGWLAITSFPSPNKKNNASGFLDEDTLSDLKNFFGMK